MPNHIDNKVSVIAPHALRELVERYVKGTPPDYVLSEVEKKFPFTVSKRVEIPFDFNRIIPVPAEVLAAGYGTAGYDWQSQNWGTKWNSYDHHEDIVRTEFATTWTFQTAWACPFPILHELSRQFSCRVATTWVDEGGSRGRVIYDKSRRPTFEMREMFRSEAPCTCDGELECPTCKICAAWHTVTLEDHAVWVDKFARGIK